MLMPSVCTCAGHNSWLRLVFIYIIPNGLWIVLPLLAVVELSSQLLKLLNTQQAKRSS